MSHPPSLRVPHKLSISSIKITVRGDSLAISKRTRTRRSESPCHLEMRMEAETEKNVESATVATTLAREDLPVVKICVGEIIGILNASRN